MDVLNGKYRETLMVLMVVISLLIILIIRPTIYSLSIFSIVLKVLVTFTRV